MIKNNINFKNIKNLTKIFIKTDSIFKNIFDKTNKKFNKKSIFFWSIIIVAIGIGYISYQCTDFFYSMNRPTLFLNIFFMFLLYFIMFQTTLTCTNVFYFSKDIELVLPLPIKPIEILISKFNTIVISSYFLEGIIAVMPLIMYGIDTNASLIYYFWMAIILIVFPIFPILIISSIMMIVIKLTKFIKKKDILQIIIVIIFSCIISNSFSMIINEVTEIQVGADVNNEQAYYSEKFVGMIDKFNNVENKFLIINPSINVLSEKSVITKILNLLLIMLYNIAVFFVFAIIGKLTYMKEILNNIIYNLSKSKEKINLENRCKQKKIWRRYIGKEFKVIFRNPIYLIQSIFPSAILMVIITILVIQLAPGIKGFLETEIIQTQFENFEIDISLIAVILCGIQILFTFSNNISITAISREGKNIDAMKYLPISIFKQLIYKSIPQIILNTIIIVGILFLIQYVDEYFPYTYLAFIGIISIIFSMINSILMIVVDFKRPNLNWDSEYEVIKQNNNKLFQYVWTIIVIVFLVNFSKALKDDNLIMANVSIVIIAVITLVLLCIWLKKKCNKLMEKI